MEDRKRKKAKIETDIELLCGECGATIKFCDECGQPFTADMVDIACEFTGGTFSHYCDCVVEKEAVKDEGGAKTL